MKKVKLLLVIVTMLVVLAPLSVIASGEPIKIGLVSSLQMEAGIGAKNAAIMASEEINGAGGILGRKLELFLLMMKLALSLG